MKLTIKEIAKMAGVSQATVSKIINNYDDVGARTKQKVLNIMEENGYRPSYSAQSLARNVTKVIGVIYAGKINANFNHPFFVDVVSSFKKTMGAKGYDLLFFSNEKFHKADENYLERCQHYNVDGCIVIGGEEVEPSVFDLDKSSIPCVGVDIKLTGEKSGYIMTDNAKVAALAVEQFYLCGYREVGFIGGKKDSLVSHERLSGFEHEVKRYGLTLKSDWIKYGDFFEESGYACMKELIHQDSCPRAVFAASDLMAFGAMQAIKDSGLDVEDFAIIGCDDITAAQYVDPSLTTIKQDKEKIGKMAAFVLIDMIEGKMHNTSIKAEPELIVRGSCRSE